MLLCLVMGALSAATVSAQEIPVNCLHQGPRILVPVRGVFEATGASVEWFAEANSVQIKSGDKVVVISVGETQASINEQVVGMEVPARNWNERVFVPVRFVGEALGRTVDYQGDKIVLGSAAEQGMVLRIASRVVIPERIGSTAAGVTGCASCGR